MGTVIIINMPTLQSDRLDLAWNLPMKNDITRILNIVYDQLR